MITKNYKGHEIVVTKIFNNIGVGYRATFSANGGVRSVESYRDGIIIADMLAGVQEIIDSNLF